MKENLIEKTLRDANEMSLEADQLIIETERKLVESFKQKFNAFKNSIIVPKENRAETQIQSVESVWAQFNKDWANNMKAVLN